MGAQSRAAQIDYRERIAGRDGGDMDGGEGGGSVGGEGFERFQDSGVERVVVAHGEYTGGGRRKQQRHAVEGGCGWRVAAGHHCGALDPGFR